MQKIEKYLKLLKRKDLYTYQHSLRVYKYSTIIGENLGLSNENLLKLKYASLLHDIGKLFIPNDILKKKQKLNDKEFNIIKKHTIFAKKILKKDYDDIINDIVFHHERLDGSGYYNKKEISLNSQIIAIADSFDAMTTNRGYNNVLTYEEAFNELFKCTKQGKYNKQLLDIFYYNFDNIFFKNKINTRA